MEKSPLDRIQGESKRANAAFIDYAHMGPARSIRELHKGYKKLAEDTGDIRRPPTRFISTLWKWSKIHKWQERVAEWDVYQRRMEIVAYEEERKEERARRVNVLRATRAKLSKQLAMIDESSLTWNELLTGVRMVVSELRKEYDDEPTIRLAAKLNDMSDDDLRTFIQGRLADEEE